MNKPTGVLLYIVPALLALGAVAALGLKDPTYIPFLTRDPAAQANIHPLSGLLSSLGVLLWFATASICLFGSWLLRRQHAENFEFLLGGGLISLYLSLDDFFMIHESLAPIYIGAGDTTMYAAIGISVVYFLFHFRKTVLHSNYFRLLLALGFLFASILFDEAFDRLGVIPEDWGYYFEDGFKWLGIVMWAGYFIPTTRDLIDNDLDG